MTVIMEGYDVTLLGSFYGYPIHLAAAFQLLGGCSQHSRRADEWMGNSAMGPSQGSDRISGLAFGFHLCCLLRTDD
jgi:hypothetical protein